MGKIAFFTFLLLLPASFLSAQDVTDSAPASKREGLTYEKMMSSISGSVSAPSYLSTALQSYISDNSIRRNACYRIRIYFNNSQNARTVSSEVAQEFRERYPSVPVYNQYANPYFKVTVGDFRTKSDAMKFMTEIKNIYTSAFLVKETYAISSSERQ